MVNLKGSIPFHSSKFYFGIKNKMFTFASSNEILT